ncbi:hypothetical protein I79_009006 [Cricetulus griseus]|uniref:Uncharacterized protein n=1 Tax=Cricetulus griseus TaxID=10029 RepID=G3HEL9_CRIGR|nr:hypothetical protein I79_009006 [Cricetulus griseus]
MDLKNLSDIYKSPTQQLTRALTVLSQEAASFALKSLCYWPTLSFDLVVMD